MRLTPSGPTDSIFLRDSFTPPSWAAWAIWGAILFWGLDTGRGYFHLQDLPAFDRFALQFRGEAFNVFNHTNFHWRSDKFDGIHNLTIQPFGQASGTFNPRQLQFGLKLSVLRGEGIRDPGRLHGRACGVW